MKTEKLNYYLPKDLIAQQPADKRENSRLLVLDRQNGTITDTDFGKIIGLLQAGDCLVLNNTRVLPARFYAERQTGGALEGLFVNTDSQNNWKVFIKGAGKLKPKEKILLLDRNRNVSCLAILVEKLKQGQCFLEIESQKDYPELLEEIGFAPLPPYIKRDNTNLTQSNQDRQRYQTVFASSDGAVAAPTAGLHFTNCLLSQLKSKGVETAFVTLHVGAGTFRPVKTEKLEDHNIHSEYYSVDNENAEIINQSRTKGGRIIAVGTTSVRTLETVAEKGSVKPASGDTRLFIQPGYEYKIVDGMITNFHLPKSTLLALVCAFAGMDNVFNAYRHAVEQKYRFYSYGDAMFVV
jgi:S-adenosylmethionine:tRNA ribosyltransferase-isomerase